MGGRRRPAPPPHYTPGAERRGRSIAAAAAQHEGRANFSPTARRLNVLLLRLFSVLGDASAYLFIGAIGVLEIENDLRP